MRRLITLLALTVVACGVLGPTPSATTAPAISPQAGQATDAYGPFRLTFVLPRTTWGSNEAIEGEAQLALTVGTEVQVFGSSGLLAFEFREVGGDRHMEPVWNLNCARYSLAADRPMVSKITKSGAWSDDEPDSDFYRGFYMDPVVRLPAGEWDITAIAMFAVEPGCGGGSPGLRATVRVLITN